MKPIEIKSDKRILRGMIHEAINTVNSVVVIVHGYFSSNRIGYNQLYLNIANKLASNGFTIVRFDLSGMGESDGNLNEIHFENHTADVQNIVLYISNKYKRKVILIGHSIGCLISLQSYYNNPALLGKIILLSPLYFDDTILSRFFDKNMIKELKETGRTCRKGINVDYSFFDEQMSLSNVANKIKECKIPITLMVGNSDPFFEIKEIEKLQKATDIAPIIISDGDHNFSDKSIQNLLINEINIFLNH